MKKVDAIKTITFEVNKEPGFLVDIVENKELYYAWLYHKDYGIKELMFGSAKDQHPNIDDFIDMVEANIDNQYYVLGYKDEYFDQ